MEFDSRLRSAGWQADHWERTVIVVRLALTLTWPSVKTRHHLDQPACAPWTLGQSKVVTLHLQNHTAIVTILWFKRFVKMLGQGQNVKTHIEGWSFLLVSNFPPSDPWPWRAKDWERGAPMTLRTTCRTQHSLSVGCMQWGLPHKHWRMSNVKMVSYIVHISQNNQADESQKKMTLWHAALTKTD